MVMSIQWDHWLSWKNAETIVYVQINQQEVFVSSTIYPF